MTKNLKKFTGDIKDVQATEEAFSPQKRTSSTLNHKMSEFFLFFVGLFCPPGSVSGSPSYRRGLQPSKENIQHFRT
jgi:hypothetical protein